MAQARKFAVAATLPNGEALIAGGEGSSGSEEGIELYKPSEEKFVAVSGVTLQGRRVGARAATLQDGDVVVVGGAANLPAGVTLSLLSSELIAPLSSGIKVVGGPTFEGTGGIAPVVAPLANGDLLIAGGFSYIKVTTLGTILQASGKMLSGGALYSPSEEKVLTQSLQVLEERYAPATLDFDGGRFVYVVGGVLRNDRVQEGHLFEEAGPFVPTAEAFDPQTNTFSLSEWQPVIPREDASVAMVGEKAFLFGGEANPYLGLSANNLSPLTAVEEIENPAPRVTFGGGAFGEVAVGHAATQTVVVSDVGYEPLTGVTASISGPGATAYRVIDDGCASATVPAGTSCAVLLSFDPPTTGAANAELKLSDSLGQSFSFPLSGTGANLGSSGPAGPTGPAGSAGAPGKVEILSCRLQTKRVRRHHHLRKVHLQLCTGRLVSGPVKVQNRTVKVSLRHGRKRGRRGFLIARGRKRVELAFPTARSLKAGRYRLWIGRRGSAVVLR